MLFIVVLMLLGSVGSICHKGAKLFSAKRSERVVKQGGSVFICRDLPAAWLRTTGSEAEMKLSLYFTADTLFSAKQNIQPQTSLFRPFVLESKHTKKLYNEGIRLPSCLGSGLALGGWVF